MNHRGFIRNIIFIAIALIILGFLGLNVSGFLNKILDSSIVEKITSASIDIFNWIKDASIYIWNNYLKEWLNIARESALFEYIEKQFNRLNS